MAGKKDNIKALFSNTRTRIIIVFTVLLVLTTIVIGFIKFNKSFNLPVGADISRAPGSISSIPGSLKQTEQYAELQQQQNIEQAQNAAQKGKSAIPTIIRSQAFGEGVEAVGATGGKGSVGFATLAREDFGGPQNSLWFQNLKDSDCSKASIDKAVNENNASIADIRLACSCEKLKLAGYGLTDLKPVCKCESLRKSGFSAKEFKQAGYQARELKQCGFTACEERAAGFSAQEMKDAGYSDGELKGAGFSDQDIARAGGVPDGVTLDDIKKAGCTVEGLKRLRAAGVSAAAIRRTNGCTAAQMKAAGFSAKDLKNAGFSAAELKAAGFSPEELKAAGYSARDLLNAGFTPEDLKAAGFTDEDLKAAEALLPPGFNSAGVKEAGCSVEAIKRERLAGVSAEMIKKHANCSAAQLKAGGFSNDDLLRAGFKPSELGAAKDVSAAEVAAAGCDAAKLKALREQGVSAKRIHEMNGCSAAQLKAAGFSAKELANAGFTPEDLLAAGFTPEEVKQAMNEKGAVADDLIKAAGCDPNKLKELRDQGVSAKRIHELNGCSAAQLKAAGFSSEDLASAGFPKESFDDNALKEAGCDADKLKLLREKGISAKRIHEINGCSAEQLKAAGFSAKDLANAGFTPADLLAAGFTPEELTKAGVAISPAGVVAAGRKGDCSVQSLKAAKAMGVSATTIKETLGCSAKAMKDAGYTAAELKAAGYTAAELKNAGFSPAELKAAGFSAKDLRAAGFSAQDLKDAGFSAADLKDAGFSAEELKNAGFSADELKKAGFSASELKAAGFSAADLKAAGFSAKDLKDAGFSATQLKNAGFTDADLQNAGVSTKDSALAGLDEISPSKAPTSDLSTIPSLVGKTAQSKEDAQAANAKHLQAIMEKQRVLQVDQKYQQQIQKRTALMLTAANQIMQPWKTVAAQQYVEGNEKDDKSSTSAGKGAIGANGSLLSGSTTTGADGSASVPLIRMGDILFAVIDTSVNTDEPGPILATIVSGPFKGGKLIGSFNLPSNADKMVISFNSLSMPGAPKTLSINAFAIDPNTARTALASESDHHYLERYGSLFASTFLEGFGNAFQSADTTIEIGGTGGVTNTTVQNGIGRSALENAVIGLATLGKAWGQVAQQNMSRPTTVQLYSGTAVGVLFTQDLMST